MNQSPNSLAADLTTREDLNGMANSRVLRRNASEIEHLADDDLGDSPDEKQRTIVQSEASGVSQSKKSQIASPIDVFEGSGSGGRGRREGMAKGVFQRSRDVVKKFGHFIGPGMMVSLNQIICLINID